MAEAEAQREEEGEVAFEAYGVRGHVRAPRQELLDRVRPLLPPGWTPAQTSSSEREFSIAEVDGAFEVKVDDASMTRSADLELALGVLDAQIRAYVAFQAPERIFVHAGVVGHGGGAILVPGASFSGKTSLVAALVRAGATYYSDEYAVLDENGIVHPYPKPLSIRGAGSQATDHPPSALGGTVGTDPLPVSIIAVTSYRPAARWQPETQSPGAGAMALLANTVPARDRPAEALSAVRKAAEPALVLEGERGEADEAAADLLARAPAGAPS